MIQKIKVTEPGRLLQLLRTHFSPEFSVKALKRMVESRRCRVNGRLETFSTAILKKGDVVTLDLEENKTKFSIFVLYEDDDFVICNKPVGIVCDDATLNKHLPKYRGKLQLIHRLDKETSGVLMLAKSSKALDAMIALFKKNGVEKHYLALVDGLPLKDEGKIDTHLAKKKTYQGQTVYGSAPKGQRAITHWKCLKRGAKASLLHCQPITGRTHQLRVHLKEIGHPILGDTQYSRTFSCPFPAHRILLHAEEVTFTHPFTNDEVSVYAPLPDDFIEAEKALF